MRSVGFVVYLLLYIGGVAWGAPADCPSRALASKPANLADILKEHSRWLARSDTRTPKGSQADLSYRDLTGVLLSEVDLRRADFTGSKLQGAKLERARLDEAEFTCVLADGASFEAADLFRAKLTNISLVGSNLTHAKLGGAVLFGAELANTDFSGADMRRAILTSAALRNTKLKEARFADVDLLNALWQPVDLPELATMGSAEHLSSMRLDGANPDPGAMTRLVADLRKAGLEDRAKEVVSARERAMTSLDLAKWGKDWDIISLGRGIFRTAEGLLTGYGLCLTCGVLVLLVCTLLSVLVYYIWGFSSAPDRKTGIVIITPEKTLASSLTGDVLTKEAKVKQLAPTSWTSRLVWAVSFAGVTSVRSGIGPINLLEVLKHIFSWKVMDVTGWLRRVANAQAFISFLLIGCLVYAYLL